MDFMCILIFVVAGALICAFVMCFFLFGGDSDD